MNCTWGTIVIGKVNTIPQHNFKMQRTLCIYLKNNTLTMADILQGDNMTIVYMYVSIFRREKRNNLKYTLEELCMH